MDIIELRELCLSFPHTTEEFPFDETTLVFKVFNKMFCCTDIMPFEWIAVKCDPDRAIELREKYPEITTAHHFNKKHWNGIDMHGSPDGQIHRGTDRTLIPGGHQETSQKFCKRKFPGILTYRVKPEEIKTDNLSCP